MFRNYYCMNLYKRTQGLDRDQSPTTAPCPTSSRSGTTIQRTKESQCRDLEQEAEGDFQEQEAEGDFQEGEEEEDQVVAVFQGEEEEEEGARESSEGEGSLEEVAEDRVGRAMVLQAVRAGSVTAADPAVDGLAVTGSGAAVAIEAKAARVNTVAAGQAGFEDMSDTELAAGKRDFTSRIRRPGQLTSEFLRSTPAGSFLFFLWPLLMTYVLN